MHLILLAIFSITQTAFSISYSYTKEITTTDTDDYQIGWFETNVDHFSFENDDTFSVRYVYSPKVWHQQGPVFFYAGNEGDIFGFVKNTGFMWEIADQFSATVIFVEHRYYGESIPYFGTPNFNESSFSFLSVEQAMYDYIHLISQMFPNRPLIAFGGSYGGMLAAWLRMKYPAYITGAVAASAPIMLIKPSSECSGVFNVITKSFRQAENKSVSNIHALFDLLATHKTDPKYSRTIWHKLNLCPKDDENLEIVLQNVVDILFNVAMVNYGTPSSLIVPMPAHPVKIIASFFNKPEMTEEELVSGLLKTLKMYFEGITPFPSCFDFDNMYGTLGMAPWVYQSCTEMLINICSIPGPDNMFPAMSQSLSSSCSFMDPIKPRLGHLARMMNPAGLSAASRIIFTNGDLDPWSAGGFYGTSNPNLTVIVIKGGAHHSDLRSSSPHDSQSLKDARLKIVEVIKGWLG